MRPWRNTEHRDLIVELARLFQPHTYVEIGVKRGYVFNSVSPHVKRAVAVDIAPMDRVVRLPHVEIHQCMSAEFSRQWRDPIDLLFIDADHRKEAVLEDFDNFSACVREGSGLILLHDTHPVKDELMSDGYCGNAWEAAAEIHSAVYYSDFEIVTLPGPWAGLSICRKVTGGHLSVRI
jgi:predicted O-methyltransferase YrrM